MKSWVNKVIHKNHCWSRSVQKWALGESFCKTFKIRGGCPTAWCSGQLEKSAGPDCSMSALTLAYKVLCQVVHPIFLSTNWWLIIQGALVSARHNLRATSSGFWEGSWHSLYVTWSWPQQLGWVIPREAIRAKRWTSAGRALVRYKEVYKSICPLVRWSWQDRPKNWKLWRWPEVLCQAPCPFSLSTNQWLITLGDLTIQVTVAVHLRHNQAPFEAHPRTSQVKSHPRCTQDTSKRQPRDMQGAPGQNQGTKQLRDYDTLKALSSKAQEKHAEKGQSFICGPSTIQVTITVDSIHNQAPSKAPPRKNQAASKVHPRHIQETSERHLRSNCGTTKAQNSC